MKKALLKFWKWLKGLWGRRAQILADARALVAALRIANEILNSQGARDLLDAIPGDLDNRVAEALKAAIRRILAIVDAVEKLPTGWPKDPTAQNMVMEKSAAQALMTLHNLPESEADLWIQNAYFDFKNQGN